jgi:predicted PurR-regulated permease PerM
VKEERFNFKFLNLIMYIGAIVAIFYVLQNLGVMSKVKEILVSLVPVFVGLLVCWLSMPLASRLKKWGLKDKLAAIISLVIIFGIITLLISFIIPLMVQEISKLIVELPNIYSNVITKINDFLYTNLSVEPGQGIDITNNLNTIDIIKKNLNSIVNYSLNTVQSVTSILISIFTVVVVSFFLVKDMDRFKQNFIEFLAGKNKNGKRYRMITEIDDLLMSYIKGLLLDSFIVGVLVTIACYFLGIDYAIIFGVLIIILNLIPYIGALFSETIISLYALSTGGIWFAVLTFAIMLTIQIIDSNILQPNIVAKSVNLHPVTVFCALIIFNALMGIVGMIIAVPIVVILKIIFKNTLIKDDISKFVKKGVDN